MKALKIIVLFVAVLITSNTSAQTEVFVTEQGKSYHKKECRFLPKSHIETSIKRAKAKGYLACKVCVPKEKIKGTKTVIKKKTAKKTKVKKSTSKKSYATRCTATTQKGAQCKRRTKNTSGKCWQHE